MSLFFSGSLLYFFARYLWTNEKARNMAQPMITDMLPFPNRPKIKSNPTIITKNERKYKALSLRENLSKGTGLKAKSMFHVLRHSPAHSMTPVRKKSHRGHPFLHPAGITIPEKSNKFKATIRMFLDFCVISKIISS